MAAAAVSIKGYLTDVCEMLPGVDVLKLSNRQPVEIESSKQSPTPSTILEFGVSLLQVLPISSSTAASRMVCLPVVLSQEQLDHLAADAKDGLELVNQLVKSPNHTFKFDVEPFRKHCLVNDLDDIGLTMQKDGKFAQFGARHTVTWPWSDGKNYTTGKANKINVLGAKKQKLDW